MDLPKSITFSNGSSIYVSYRNSQGKEYDVEINDETGKNIYMNIDDIDWLVEHLLYIKKTFGEGACEEFQSPTEHSKQPGR